MHSSGDDGGIVVSVSTFLPHPNEKNERSEIIIISITHLKESIVPKLRVFLSFIYSFPPYLTDKLA